MSWTSILTKSLEIFKHEGSLKDPGQLSGRAGENGFERRSRFEEQWETGDLTRSTRMVLLCDPSQKPPATPFTNHETHESHRSALARTTSTTTFFFFSFFLLVPSFRQLVNHAAVLSFHTSELTRRKVLRYLLLHLTLWENWNKNRFVAREKERERMLGRMLISGYQRRDCPI